MTIKQSASQRYRITRYDSDRPIVVDDDVVMEEPLEVWLEQGTRRKRLGVTMRTPGNDEELATGLLFSEGVIASGKDIASIRHAPFPGDEQEFNSVRVRLRAGLRADWEPSGRARITSSACGICGRSTIDDLKARFAPVRGAFRFDPAILPALPTLLRSHQGVFATTGGLHAAALVDVRGRLVLLREDVGRHNAVDKLVGRCLKDGRVPIPQMLVVSGRAGFEIVQKAIQARVPLVAAVGAPSSLAVDLAREFHVTLVGFLREDRFNVYAGEERLAWASAGSVRTSLERASRPGR